MTQPDVNHLMLIGAYRDNEVNSAHPLMRKLEAIRQAGGNVKEIVLAPLACKDLGRLIADSLHCDPENAAPLAQLIHEKTTGNPFFTIQFISALAEEELLKFDHGEARWSWDVSASRKCTRINKELAERVGFEFKPKRNFNELRGRVRVSKY